MALSDAETFAVKAGTAHNFTCSTSRPCCLVTATGVRVCVSVVGEAGVESLGTRSCSLITGISCI